MTTDEAPPPEPAKRRPRLGGCLPRIVVGIVVVIAIIVAIGFAFDEGDNADQPISGFDAGNAEAFPTSTVNRYESQHLYITRMPDGSFIALYDKSARQQELHGDCRVMFQDTQGAGTLEPIAGISGAFVEDCNNARAVWRADGTYAFGVGYGDLDRFGTSINNNGDLIIDTSSRSCTRSRGVIGVEPFDITRCGTGD